MKTFETPGVDVKKFDVMDVLTTSGETCPLKVVSSIMRKIDYSSGRNLLQGAGYRPLVMIQRAGRKGSRAAVRRLSCP